jgi:hypothetical protein
LPWRSFEGREGARVAELTDPNLRLAQALMGWPLQPDPSLGNLPFLTWDEAVIRAKDGDTVAAKILLLLASACLRKDRTTVTGPDGEARSFASVPLFVADYLAEALGAIANGKAPNAALNLRRNPGSAKFGRDDFIVYAIDCCRHRGLKPNAAYAFVADALNVSGGKTDWSEDTIRKIVEKRQGKKQAMVFP